MLLTVRQHLFSSGQIGMIIYSSLLILIPIIVFIYAMVRCLTDLKHYKLIKCEECVDYQD